jgi:hypothetical protein
MTKDFFFFQFNLAWEFFNGRIYILSLYEYLLEAILKILHEKCQVTNGSETFGMEMRWIERKKEPLTFWVQFSEDLDNSINSSSTWNRMTIKFFSKSNLI